MKLSQRARAFYFLDLELNNMIKTIMREIIFVLNHEIPHFTPDKRNLSSRILLKHGNFEAVLS